MNWAIATRIGSITIDIRTPTPAEVGPPPDVDATGLAVWYKFNDTTTTDASVNGNTGTIAGSGTTLVTGHIGSALSFNGSGYVTFTSVALLGLASATSEISIACWIKSTGTDCTIVSLRDAGSALLDFVTGFNGLANAGTGKLSIIVRDSGGGGLNTATSSAAVHDNTWHHVAMTRTSAKLITLYIDGASDGTVTDTMSAALTPAWHNQLSVMNWLPVVVA